MTKEFLKRETLILTVLIAPIVFLIAVWNRLPEQMPMQWNLKGEVSSYGPRYLTSLIAVGIYILMLVLPKIDPRKKNYDIFSETYFKLRLLIILFFGLTNSIAIAGAIGFEINMSRYIIIAVLGLFVILGNYMGTLRPNWFIGIRLPWTLESDAVWTKTHRMAGKLWFWLGLAALVSAIFLPENIIRPLVFSVVVIMVAVPIVYAYAAFRNEQKAG